MPIFRLNCLQFVLLFVFIVLFCSRFSFLLPFPRFRHSVSGPIFVLHVFNSTYQLDINLTVFQEETVFYSFYVDHLYSCQFLQNHFQNFILLSLSNRSRQRISWKTFPNTLVLILNSNADICPIKFSSENCKLISYVISNSYFFKLISGFNFFSQIQVQR